MLWRGVGDIRSSWRSLRVGIAFMGRPKKKKASHGI